MDFDNGIVRRIDAVREFMEELDRRIERPQRCVGQASQILSISGTMILAINPPP